MRQYRRSPNQDVDIITKLTMQIKPLAVSVTGRRRPLRAAFEVCGTVGQRESSPCGNLCVRPGDRPQRRVSWEEQRQRQKPAAVIWQRGG